MPHTSTTIAPRDKSQARGQNSSSRASKWGIVYLCRSITFRDKSRYTKKLVSQILHFCLKKCGNYCVKLKKCDNLEIMKYLWNHTHRHDY